MSRPLPAIVSAITSNVNKGLDGTQNVPFTAGQLEDDINSERGDMAIAGIRSRIFQPNDFMQSFVAELEDPTECIILGGKPARRCWIPAPMVELDKKSIAYAGPQFTMDGNTYAVYVDDTGRLHGARKYGGDRPALWVNASVQMEDEELGILVEAWVINPEPRMAKLLVRGVFSDPRQAFKFNGELELYPAPEAVVKNIIHNLSQKYLMNYRGGAQKGPTAAQLAALQAANASPQQTEQ